MTGISIPDRFRLLNDNLVARIHAHGENRYVVGQHAGRLAVDFVHAPVFGEFAHCGKGGSGSFFLP